jgi:hypothetical protein
MRSRASSLPALVLVARRGAAARGIALQRSAQVLDQRAHGSAVIGKFRERMSILEAILAIGFVGSHCKLRQVAKLSDSPIIQRFGSDDNGHPEPWPALPRIQFRSGEDIDAVRDQVRRFAEERIAPRANEIDRSNVFPRDLWPRARRAGAARLTVSPTRRRRLGLSGAHRRHGGDLARLGRRRLELRRAFESVRESARAECERLRRSGAICRSSSAASTWARSRCPSPAPDRTSCPCSSARKARRSLRARRPQDVDHQRPGGRCAGGVRQDRPEAGARGISAFIIEKGFKGFTRRRSSTSWACAARAPANWCSTAARCPRESARAENRGRAAC